jgi:hypothetical protein
MPAAPFTFAVDHEKKQVLMKFRVDRGTEVAGHIEFDEINALMAVLSHRQHVLALAHAGQRLEPPIDPNIAFGKSGQHVLGALNLAVSSTSRMVSRITAARLTFLPRSFR